MCRGSHMRVLALVNLVWLSESLSTAVHRACGWGLEDASRNGSQTWTSTRLIISVPCPAAEQHLRGCASMPEAQLPHARKLRELHIDPYKS